MKYNTVIGIEIHLELLTKTKMFDMAPVGFGLTPNSLITQNSLGYPGALPIVNEKGVKLALRACSYLNMKIEKTLQFDRKQYFYVDLPKGYQITQSKKPIGTNGFLEISDLKIPIIFLQIEEDTAKVIRKKNKILIDYNRSGNPLIEIVTAPVFKNENQVLEYLKLLKNIMYWGKISKSKLEEGSFRCDVNISLSPNETPGTKVEIKNLNSFSNIENSIKYEINRQESLLNKGEKIQKETRRWDESKKETIHMRYKFGANDYKFISETNIAPITLDENFIKQAILCEGLNLFKLQNFFLKKDFTPKQISEIINSEYYHFVEYFYVNNYQDYDYFKILFNDFSAALTQNNISISQNKISPKQLYELCQLNRKENLNQKVFRSVLTTLITKGGDLEETLKKNSFEEVKDPFELLGAVKKLTSHDIIKKSQEKLFNNFGKSQPRMTFLPIEKFLIGQVMKIYQGKVNISILTWVILFSLIKDMQKISPSKIIYTINNKVVVINIDNTFKLPNWLTVINELNTNKKVNYKWYIDNNKTIILKLLS